MVKLTLMLSCVLAFLGCQSQSKVPVSDRSISANTPPKVYIAGENDNLFLVSMKYNLDYQTLGQKNGIRYPYRLHKGQRILLSGSGSESIGSGAGKVNVGALGSSPKVVRVKAPSRVRTTPKPVQEVVTITAPVKAASKTKRVYGTRWQWPVRGKVVQNFAQSELDYKGIDIAGKQGLPIHAAANGIVVYAGDDGLAKYGKLIIINHNDESLSAYAHNSKLLVNEGQEVKRGQVVAKMGSTGTNKVKLHFEIRKDGESVDPQKILPKQ